MFKEGDILIAKGDSLFFVNRIHLTTGNQYRINSIEKSSNFIDTSITNNIINESTLSITDDNGEPWFFFINKEDDEYYYGNFFYTKSEWRDMKLKSIGI